MTENSKHTPILTVRTYGGENQAHSHAFHQFVLPLTGALALDADGKGGCVDDRRAALVPAGTIHAFHANGATRCVVLDVPETASDGLDSIAGAGPFFSVDPALHHLLQFIGHRPAAKGIEPLLLSTALGSLTVGKTVPQEPAKLRRALIFMEAHAGQPLSVHDIADAAAMSESRLYDLFRLWIGIGPAQHLAQIRLRRARLAIQQQAGSLAQIALSAGFSDQSSFTRAFRREYGLTPAAYRREKNQK